jgi:hypothetical protein
LRLLVLLFWPVWAAIKTGIALMPVAAPAEAEPAHATELRTSSRTATPTHPDPQARMPGTVFPAETTPAPVMERLRPPATVLPERVDLAVRMRAMLVAALVETKLAPVMALLRFPGMVLPGRMDLPTRMFAARLVATPGQAT